jgi:hypothetical protein
VVLPLRPPCPLCACSPVDLPIVARLQRASQGGRGHCHGAADEGEGKAPPQTEAPVLHPLPSSLLHPLVRVCVIASSSRDGIPQDKSVRRAAAQSSELRSREQRRVEQERREEHVCCKFACGWRLAAKGQGLRQALRQGSKNAKRARLQSSRQRSGHRTGHRRPRVKNKRWNLKSMA